LITALALLGALTAPPTDQLDRWIVAAKGAERILVVPQIRSVLQPLSRLVAGLPTTDVLALDDPGFELLDAAAHAANGLNLDGPLFYAEVAPHPVIVAAVVDAKGYLDALGTAPTPATVLGQPGFKTTEGLALVRDGLLYISKSEGAMKRFIEAPSMGAAGLAGCADGPGEADLFVLSKSPFGRACGTLRVEPDRLRVQMRTPVGSHDPTTRWLADGDDRGLYTRLGANATSIIYVGLTRAALGQVSGGTFGDFMQALDGRIAVGIGEKTSQLTAVLGVSDAARAEQVLSKLIAEAHEMVRIVKTAPRRWRIDQAAPLPVGAALTANLPTTAWLQLTDTEIILTTDARRLDDKGDAFGGTRAEIERTVLFGGGAPMAFAWHRVGGRPHDGVALADAVGTSLSFLDIEPAELRDFTALWAKFGARIGDWALSLRRSTTHVTAAVEVILL
jgi:hypothetical protein